MKRLRAALGGAERVHLIGLVSKGGVHSSEEHLKALIAIAADANVPDLVILDEPTTGLHLADIEKLLQVLEHLQVAMP